MNIEQVWPGWNVERMIGKGSYGAVYRCFKTGENGKEYAAVKVISVPQDDYDADSVGSEGLTGEQSREYYKDITDNFINEIKILEALKDEKHIVNIQDSRVIEKEDGIGWQIFIRMELLTDFNTYASDKAFTAEDVRKIALDLCDALIVCGKKRIVHRDIKPENIFVDADGNFKLGDFGVAKQLEKTYASMSTKGTYNYMAPEVVASKKYDSRADIYSLGIVMYKLLNNNRLPFLDPDKKLIRFSERQEAFERRIKGEKIPPLPGVSDDLNEIILRACEFRPEDRYHNVEEFRDALSKEKTAGRFVRMIKKHKAVSALAFLLVLSLLSGCCGYAFSALKAKRSAYPEKPVVIGVDDKVASLNGIGIVNDGNGIRAIYETAGREEHLADQEANAFAFNGKQICYSCSSDIAYYEVRMLDVETKEDQLLFLSDENVKPIFFDHEGVFVFNDDFNKLFYYSSKKQSYEQLNWDVETDIIDWSVEQKDEHILLVYSQETDQYDDFGFSNNIYVMDLNEVEEEPDPIISGGKLLCTDNENIYYASKTTSYVSVFMRKFDNKETEEVIKVPVDTFDSIMSDKTEEYGYNIVYEDVKNLFPINRRFVSEDVKEGICDTLYDVFTQKTYQFIVDKNNIEIVPAGNGIFGFYTYLEDQDLVEEGYINPVSESAIRFTSEPSKLSVCVIDDRFEVFPPTIVNENGVYYWDTKGDKQIIVFKSVDLQKTNGFCF